MKMTMKIESNVSRPIKPLIYIQGCGYSVKSTLYNSKTPDTLPCCNIHNRFTCFPLRFQQYLSYSNLYRIIRETYALNLISRKIFNICYLNMATFYLVSTCSSHKIDNRYNYTIETLLYNSRLWAISQRVTFTAVISNIFAHFLPYPIAFKISPPLPIKCGLY